MKPLLLTLTLLVGLNMQLVWAQAPNNAPAINQEMQKLAYFSGQWKGEATMRRGNTPPIKIIQEEDIQFKLDGTVLLIEGKGFAADNPQQLVFNALGVVSYNPYTKQFGMKSHTNEGNQTDAYFKIIADNHFEWGFETPQKAKIKYDIVLDPVAKTWVEKGEYSADGTTWYPFIELKLSKLN